MKISEFCSGFPFLKLIDCENYEVGEFSKFVKFWNKTAQPGGTIVLTT